VASEVGEAAAGEPAPVPEPSAAEGSEPELARSRDGAIQLDDDAPYDSARIFAGLHYKQGGARTLLHHQGQFYRYSKNWQLMDAGALRHELYDFLDRAVIRRQGGHDRFRPDTTKVNKVVDALAAVVNLPTDTTTPAWLDSSATENPKEILACQNGLLHLPTRKLMPHSPQFWSLNVLEFDYDSAAECPRWSQFAEEVWGADDEAIATLQEMFGLCITDETRFQKGFLLVGPKRSGKGTIGRVLRGLVGADNYVGPTLSGFTKPHGMQGWIGKKVAVFSDARLEAANTVVTERLLSVIGEDVLDVERKFLSPWTGVLPIRIVVLTNEIPRFRDDSGALPSRFLVLEMTKSFYGNEDIHLTEKLLAERPGILNWALDGLDALRDRGHFVQPKSGEEAAETLLLTASNIHSFVEERCEFGAEHCIACNALWQAWRTWKDACGIRFNLEVNQFSARLKQAYPDIGVERPRDAADPKRPRYFTGIRLKSNRVAIAPAAPPKLQILRRI
jgi:putative DNA primase/helicase